MRSTKTLVAVGLMLTLAAAAQEKNKGGGKGKGGAIPAPLTINVTGYFDGGAIPAKFGCMGGQNSGVSPQIIWSGAPAGTMTFAVIFHDTDVALPNGDDVLHWAIFNIPGSATGLPENVAKTATLPDGSVQLNNIAGMPGFFNPCPPPPTTHHYILEVYAVDTKLDLPQTASRADLLKAMQGHVRAKGTYVGTFHQ
jgi:Raf kinase inhibitor-like YbhB/YbcL family protein